MHSVVNEVLVVGLAPSEPHTGVEYWSSVKLPSPPLQLKLIAEFCPELPGQQ